MRWVFWIFLVLYAVAFGLFIIGTHGLFGSDSGPLAGIFLMPLGLPWNLIGDRMGFASTSLAMFSPAINLVLLYLLQRR